jgi:hypothetical protein
VAESVATWAREADRTPDTAALTAVLAARPDPFAEDLVPSLLTALGFRFSADADPAG